MSNALLVGAKRSATGHPLLVAGPQVGHYYPGILMELDLDGGGYKARGASFPGLSFAVLLGRGIDYAWSATSAGSDLIDEYVETLCGGSDVKYLFRGECRDMTTVRRGRDQGPARPAGPAARLPRDRARPGRRVRDRRREAGRDHAASARPAAVSCSRRSFFLDLNTNVVRSAKELPRERRDDGADVQLALRRRPRHRAVHERPPAAAADDGRPRICRRRAPASTSGAASPRRSRTRRWSNPASGLILNWNNKPARGLRGLRRRVDVGVGAARRPPLGRDRSAARSTRSAASSPR